MEDEFLELENELSRMDQDQEIFNVIDYQEMQKLQNNNQQNKQLNYEYADVNYWTFTQFPWQQEIESAKKDVFNIQNFRQNQLAVINAAKQKKDLFVCMPTGGGKSILFQIPAITDSGITIVVMPLISLIQDQVAFMTNYSIQVYQLTSQIKADEISKVEQKCLLVKNFPKLLYITPEKVIKSQNFMALLEKLDKMKRLDRFVIDEAHCVSSWGRDFRPDYARLGILKRKFPHIPITALTATATDRVKIDIVNILKLNQCLYFQCSFNRTNLIYDIREKGTQRQCIDDIAYTIKSMYNKKSGIIYACTRKDCEELSSQLNQYHDLNTNFYHAAISDKKKNQIQNDWMSGDIDIIVATIAFGMGINKPDVRFVVHYGLPKSIENYYQETGRAGRDGKLSHCILYYKFGDRLMQYLLSSNVNQIQNAGVQLVKLMQFIENKFKCRREMILDYLGEKFDAKQCNNMCDNCKFQHQYQEQNLFKTLEVIINIVKANQKLTFNQLCDNLHGKSYKPKHNQRKINEQTGLLANWKKENIEKLVKQIIFNGILVEKLQIQKNQYLYLSIDYKIFENYKQEEKFMYYEITKIIKQEKSIFEKNLNKNQKQYKKFDSEYGYLEQEKYEQLFQALKIIRNNIYKKESQEVNIETFLSTIILQEFCKYLPQNLNDLNTMNIVSKLQIQKFGQMFLNEINYFIIDNNIVKKNYEMPLQNQKQDEIFDHQNIKKNEDFIYKQVKLN